MPQTESEPTCLECAKPNPARVCACEERVCRGKCSTEHKMRNSYCLRMAWAMADVAKVN